MSDKTVVFVLSSAGWVSHGPRRASERQAQLAAASVRRVAAARVADRPFVLLGKE